MTSPPPNVRIAQVESTERGPAYRSDDAVTRVITVRGSSPRSAYLALAGIVVWAALGVGVVLARYPSMACGLPCFLVPLGILLLGLAPAVARRAARWTRLSISRSSLVVETGPFGRSQRIEGWTAGRPVTVKRTDTWARPLTTLEEWDLFVERDDGGRTRLATLHDEASTRFVYDALSRAYCDAEEPVERNPFAVRFGPMPEGVCCVGDLANPRAGWMIEVRCRREGVVSDLARTTVASLVVALGLGAIRLLVLVGQSGSLVPGLVFAAVVAAFGWVAVDGLRWCAMRAPGRAIFTLEPRCIDITTKPFAGRALAALRSEGVIRLEVRPSAVIEQEAILDVTTGTRTIRWRAAPLSLDDARYVARVIDAYYAKERPPEEGGTPAEPHV